jgi:hypothetical protein
VKRPARVFLAAFVAVSLVLPHGPAWAEDAGEQSQAAATAYRQALTLYGSGDLKGALAQMRQSYGLSKRAELLYNIARIESELGDCAASLADYRLYVQQVPDGRYRNDAEQATRELAQRCPDVAATSAPSSAPVAALAVAEPAPAPAATPPPEPPKPVSAAPPPPPPPTPLPPRYWTTQRWIGWSLVAAGTAAGVAAVSFHAAALDARDEFRDSLNTAARRHTDPDYGLRDRQHRDSRWAQALFVTGGALLTGGVLVLVLAPAEGSTSTAALYVEPGLLGARFSHSF